jgi:hypothetical protein
VSPNEGLITDATLLFRGVTVKIRKKQQQTLK